LDIYHGKRVLVKGHALGYALAVIGVLDTCIRSLEDMRLIGLGEKGQGSQGNDATNNEFHHDTQELDTYLTIQYQVHSETNCL
jgi:hypothetical protein